MFTGLIEAVGTVERVEPGPDGGRRLSVVTPFEDIAMGESIAHDGVCLTAVEVRGPTHEVDVGPETLARTTMGQVQAGTRLNLERAVLPTTRLGGHLVQGHVDTVGTVRTVEARENAWDLWIDTPPEILRLVIPRGSVAVNGISLTVVDRDAAGFTVSIIPHTWAVTNLPDAPPGHAVNLEADLFARYVAELAGTLPLAAMDPKS